MLSQYQLVTAAQRTQVFHNCENLVDLVACEFDEMPERGGGVEGAAVGAEAGAPAAGQAI